MLMRDGFGQTVNHIRGEAESLFSQGRLFERLMKRCLLRGRLYSDRFSDVRLYGEWEKREPGFDAKHTGVNLVAAERSGRYCAIQCKCYALATRIHRRHIQSFLAAPDRAPYTARLSVHTDEEWCTTAAKTIEQLKTSCQVLRYSDLAGRPISWPDLAAQKPEDLAVRAERRDRADRQGTAKCVRRAVLQERIPGISVEMTIESDDPCKVVLSG